MDGGAGPEVSRLLGVFRRPPTAEDRAAQAELFAGPSEENLFAAVPRDGTRVIHPAAGPAVTLLHATEVFDRSLAPAARSRCEEPRDRRSRSSATRSTSRLA